MGRNIYSLVALMIFVCFSSCEERSTVPSISNVEVPATAHFGDSIPFSLVAKSEEALSLITAKIYYGEGKVLEQIFPVNNSGTFSGKLYMPYFADSLSNAVSIKFSVRNRLFEFYDLPGESVVQLSYPEFPYLVLSTIETDEEGDAVLDANGNTKPVEYRMEKVAGSTTEYKATGVFSTQTKAVIKAFAGEWGNTICFGYSGGYMSAEPEYIPGYTIVKHDPIIFQGQGTVASDLFFNVATLTPSPMPDIFRISFAESNTTILDIGSGDILQISDLANSKNFWINPSFFKGTSTSSLTFNAMPGAYKITAEYPEKDSAYLNVMPWDREMNQPLAFDPATGEGAIWVNGAGTIGIPSTTSAPRWDFTKSFAMAPKGNKKYEMQLVVGPSINSTITNFKLYGQYGSEGYVFTADPERIRIEDDALLYVANTWQENGNIRGRSSSVGPLPSGKTIVIKVDASTMPVVLTYEFK